MIDEPATAEQVFREHIDFLRTELQAKKSWYEDLLSNLKEELAQLKQERDELCLVRDQLRIALAQVVAEVEFHNHDAEDAGGYQTDDEWLAARSDLTVV